MGKRGHSSMNQSNLATVKNAGSSNLRADLATLAKVMQSRPTELRGPYKVVLPTNGNKSK